MTKEFFFGMILLPQILNKLKVLDLSCSKNLTKSPNFLQVPNLEELILEGCTGLVELDESIGHLKGLLVLNLNGCKNLKSFPRSTSNLQSLEALSMGSLDMWNHANRKTVNQQNRWNPICSVRASLHGFWSLVKLVLPNSNFSEGDFPIDLEALSSLKFLDLSRNNFRYLPHSICRLSKLRALIVKKSSSLRAIPRLPTNLITLNADKCVSLERISMADSLLRLLLLDKCFEVLFEIQSSENLPFTSAFTLEGCNKLTEDVLFMLCLDQTDSRCIYSLEAKIPYWFNHKRNGSSISFDIPALYEGELIHRLIFGFVCRLDDPQDVEQTKVSVVFHNRARSHREIIGKANYLFIGDGFYHLFLLAVRPTKIPYAKSGEEIEVSLECSQLGVEVKECGVHLLYGIQHGNLGLLFFIKKLTAFQNLL